MLQDGGLTRAWAGLAAYQLPYGGQFRRDESTTPRVPLSRSLRSPCGSRSQSSSPRKAAALTVQLLGLEVFGRVLNEELGNVPPPDDLAKRLEASAEPFRACNHGRLRAKHGWRRHW